MLQPVRCMQDVSVSLYQRPSFLETYWVQVANIVHVLCVKGLLYRTTISPSSFRTGLLRSFITIFNASASIGLLQLFIFCIEIMDDLHVTKQELYAVLIGPGKRQGLPAWPVSRSKPAQLRNACLLKGRPEILCLLTCSYSFVTPWNFVLRLS